MRPAWVTRRSEPIFGTQPGLGTHWFPVGPCPDRRHYGVSRDRGKPFGLPRFATSHLASTIVRYVWSSPWAMDTRGSCSICFTGTSPYPQHHGQIGCRRSMSSIFAMSHDADIQNLDVRERRQTHHGAARATGLPIGRAEGSVMPAARSHLTMRTPAEGMKPPTPARPIETNDAASADARADADRDREVGSARSRPAASPPQAKAS